MELILESDIIEAYLNEDIDEYDVVAYFAEGYISENTMDLLLNEDDYILEALDNVLYEMEALEENEYYDELEEGRFTRKLRSIAYNSNLRDKYDHWKTKRAQKLMNDPKTKDKDKIAAKLIIDGNSARTNARYINLLRKQRDDAYNTHKKLLKKSSKYQFSDPEKSKKLLDRAKNEEIIGNKYHSLAKMKMNSNKSRGNTISLKDLRRMSISSIKNK